MTTLASDLLVWYDRERRILPWREVVSPYRTWISEAMLQQTRVDTVIPFFERFIARFPDVGALAHADLDDVLAAWSGLGYYSRARNLHKAAQIVAESGGFPDSVAGLEALPGVGPYMAGAIASIALGQDVATVDGNIARVLARVHRDSGTRKQMWHHARRHVPAGRAGDHNQAMMDLGARICTPRSPRCGECPIQAHCEAQAAGDVSAYPPARPKRSVPTWHMACAILQRGDEVLLGQRPVDGLFGGLYEPPMFRVDGPEAAAEALCERLTQDLGLEVDGLVPVAELRHVLTHRVLQLHVHRVEARGQPLVGPYERVAWCNPESGLGSIGLSALARKAIRQGRGPERSVGLSNG